MEAVNTTVIPGIVRNLAEHRKKLYISSKSFIYQLMHNRVALKEY